MRQTLESRTLILVIAALALMGIACGGGGPAQSDVPSGTIVAFAGSTFPEGWTVCDGRQTPTGLTTPNLTDRFIMGSARPGPGELGGEASHQHAASSEPAGHEKGSCKRGFTQVKLLSSQTRSGGQNRSGPQK